MWYFFPDESPPSFNTNTTKSFSGGTRLERWAYEYLVLFQKRIGPGYVMHSVLIGLI